MASNTTTINPAHQPINMTYTSTRTSRPRKRKKQRTKLDALSKSMGADAVNNTFFVPYQPPGSAKRDIELVDAARRSYTARRWYRQHEIDEGVDGPGVEQDGLERQRRKQRRKSEEVLGDCGSSNIVGEESEVSGQRPWFVGNEAHDESNESGLGQQMQSHELHPVTDDTDHNMNLIRQRSASPWSFVSNLGPFAPGSYMLDADAFTAIEYFNRIWAENAFQSATARRSSGRIGDSEKALVVRTMMNNDLLAHAFLAAVVMRMATVHNTHTSAERHANVALGKLREQILQASGANSDHLVLPILFLAAYETYCYNIEGTRTHLRALRQLNAQQQLSGYLERLCRNIDLFSASSSLAPPILEDSLPLRPPIPTSHDSSAGAFSDYTEILGPDLLSTIAKIRALALQVEQLRTTTGTTTTTTNITSPLPATDDAETTTLHLLTLSEHLTTTLLAHLPGPPLKECTIIALLMWLSYLPARLAPAPPHPDPHHTATSPSDTFLKIIPGRGTAAVTRLRLCTPLSTPLELWILAVGVVCAVDQDDVEYCARQFAELAERIGVVDVRAVMRGFLWLDGFEVVDEGVLGELLGEGKGREGVLRKVVGWAARTGGGGGGFGVGRGVSREEEKGRCVRLTNRPSNFWRLGA